MGSTSFSRKMFDYFYISEKKSTTVESTFYIPSIMTTTAILSGEIPFLTKVAMLLDTPPRVFLNIVLSSLYMQIQILN